MTEDEYLTGKLTNKEIDKLADLATTGLRSSGSSTGQANTTCRRPRRTASGCSGS